MQSEGSVWIGKILRSDRSSGRSLVLVRGIFQTEYDARGIAEAFGCDALMFGTSGQKIELGQVAVVELTKTLTECD